MDVSGASGRLVDVLVRIDPMLGQSPSTAEIGAARDTAMAYYEHDGLSATDRSTAAYVIGTTYLLQNDSARALTWARTAQQLNPTDPAVVALLRTLEGNS